MRRCRHDIFSAMLKEARNGAKPTPLMYASKVSYTQLVRYLKILNDEGLLEKRGRLWFTTEKGRRYLTMFEALRQLEEPRRT